MGGWSAENQSRKVGLDTEQMRAEVSVMLQGRRVYPNPRDDESMVCLPSDAAA